MKTCEYYGKRFNPETESEEFFAETGGEPLLVYEQIQKCLCARCAWKAIDEDLETGIYIETCERCSRHFDLVEAEENYDRGLLGAWDRYGKILCSRCAIKLDNQ